MNAPTLRLGRHPHFFTLSENDLKGILLLEMKSYVDETQEVNLARVSSLILDLL